MLTVCMQCKMVAVLFVALALLMTVAQVSQMCSRMLWKKGCSSHCQDEMVLLETSKCLGGKMNIDHSKLSGTKIILGTHCILQVRRHSASIVDFIMNRKNYV